MMKQKRLLIILLFALGLAGGYAFWAKPRQQKISAARLGQDAGTAKRGERIAADRGAGQRLRTDLLQQTPEKYPGFQRDIFGPLFVRPAPVSPPKPSPQIAPPQPPPPPPPPVLVPVREDLARFTFLGFLLKEGKRTIFLGKEKDLFLVRKGDRFGEDARFVVLDITPELLTIRQGDDERLITIPLVEKMALVPSF